VVDAKKIGTRPILLTVIPLEQPAHGRIGRLNQLIEKLGRLDHVTVVDAGRGLTRADHNPDGIHPLDKGYRIIARNVMHTVHLGVHGSANPQRP
jgi:hypothetical protein